MTFTYLLSFLTSLWGFISEFMFLSTDWSFKADHTCRETMMQNYSAHSHIKAWTPVFYSLWQIFSLNSAVSLSLKAGCTGLFSRQEQLQQVNTNLYTYLNVLIAPTAPFTTTSNPSDPFFPKSSPLFSPTPSLSLYKLRIHETLFSLFHIPLLYIISRCTTRAGTWPPWLGVFLLSPYSFHHIRGSMYTTGSVDKRHPCLNPTSLLNSLPNLSFMFSLLFYTML